MIKRIIGLLLFLPLFVHGQGAGIQFESGLSWKQVQAKAKAENKYIFVDCYATWCGPCKWMSANIFTQKEAGDLMNARFISVAVQMDKTAKDDQAVKDWYTDADMLRQVYRIGAYPTYLVFSAEGVPLHRFIGATKLVKDFIAEVNDAFDPAKQYYTLVNQWASHKSDTTFLFNAFTAAKDQGDHTLADSIGEAYLNAGPNLLIAKNINVIDDCNLVKSSQDKWFKFLLDNADRVDNVMKYPTWAETILGRTIFREKVFSLFDKNGDVMNWKEISGNIKTDYPTVGKKMIGVLELMFRDRVQKFIRAEINKDTVTLTENDWKALSEKLDKRFLEYDHDPALLRIKADYYASKKNWTACVGAAYALMKKYGDQIDDSDINTISWGFIFLHSTDPKVLAEAAKWMKHSVDRDPDRLVSVDTYANLIYKLGKNDQAIVLEKKVIETAVKNQSNSRDMDDFNANLAKMQSGQPTWENE